ncbi:MAG TPA: polymer-forming cytoskeletal protein [Candidatus Acidoferrales bacterium]|nr:polymer-forming cytoskeletal protein [Candidatus Acidoferrales bacterium]
MKHSSERSDGHWKESFLAADITIEGKIVGQGSVRIAGKFQGDLQVHGDLTIESGAHVTGEIQADTITLHGTVQGNINASAQVTLSESGQIIGDLKAKTLTVAAGARMRGKVEFGWDDDNISLSKIDVPASRVGNGSIA